jgi:hypothetical protein
MSETIRTVDLSNDTIITRRDVTSATRIVSLDINQTTGEYLVSRPFNLDGTEGGEVVVFPQSSFMDIYQPVSIKNFSQISSLYYPLDARFDYTNNKIWIADTGNERILKIKKNNLTNVDAIARNIVFPHSLVVNLNNGGAFVKAYTDISMTKGIVYSLESNCDIAATFIFDLISINSSSSSSSSPEVVSMSTSSSSEEYIFPALPYYNSMAYDHVRSRVWWGAGHRIYMADEKNMQVQTYDINNNGFSGSFSINVELATGNAFVVVEDSYGERFLVQMFRDNNGLIATAYLPG